MIDVMICYFDMPNFATRKNKNSSLSYSTYQHLQKGEICYAATFNRRQQSSPPHRSCITRIPCSFPFFPFPFVFYAVVRTRFKRFTLRMFQVLCAETNFRGTQLFFFLNSAFPSYFLIRVPSFFFSFKFFVGVLGYPWYSCFLFFVRRTKMLSSGMLS